ncbi:MAG: hypothetical protein QM708_04615 [Propioniciclava sp.]|uniref:hypothetical protein n=1 Tax=Propioniciclava sp. TaxID=2038686 RepID=UPI0039E499BB
MPTVPGTATAPGPGRLVLLALASAAGVFLVSFLAATVGVIQGLVGVAVLLRGTAGSLMIVLIASQHAARWRPASLPPYAAVGLVSYLINPLSWSGRALFGQVTGNPFAAFALDAVWWVGLFVGAVWLRTRMSRSAPSR